MTFVGFEEKAREMFEVAMEDIHDDVNKAWSHAEELVILVGEMEDSKLQEAFDEHISMIMLHLEKV